MVTECVSILHEWLFDSTKSICNYINYDFVFIHIYRRRIAPPPPVEFYQSSGPGQAAFPGRGGRDAGPGQVVRRYPPLSPSRERFSATPPPAARIRRIAPPRSPQIGKLAQIEIQWMSENRTSGLANQTKICPDFGLSSYRTSS